MTRLREVYYKAMHVQWFLRFIGWSLSQRQMLHGGRKGSFKRRVALVLVCYILRECAGFVRTCLDRFLTLRSFPGSGRTVPPLAHRVCCIAAKVREQMTCICDISCAYPLHAQVLRTFGRRAGGAWRGCLESAPAAKPFSAGACSHAREP